MLDDIDYGGLTASPEPAPKKKSAISERKLSSKLESKPSPKPVDTGVLADRATALQEGLGAPEIGDPLAQYGLPGLGVLGGLATAYGLYQASKNKPVTPVTPPSIVGGVPAASSVQYTTAGSQPTMQYGTTTLNAPTGVPNVAAPASPPADVAPAPVDPLKEAQIRKAQADALRAEHNAQLAAQKVQAAQPKPAGTPVAAADTVANVAPETVKPTPTVADLAARAQAGREAGLGLKKTETPAVTATTEAPVVTGEAGASVAPTSEQTKKTRAPKTEQKTYKAVPEGHVFIPEMGNLDQAMQNIYGEEGRKYARDLLTEGKHFGFAPKGKGEYNKAVQDLSAKYMQALQGQIPETLLSREERIAQGIPHGGIGNYGGLGKLAKVAGVTGTLLSAAEAAKAAQQGKYGEAAAQGVDIATDYIPFISQLKQGLAPQGAIAPGVSAKQFENAYKLGSPYAQTEEAKKARLKEKAGAGRGIAPPSAYQR